MAHRPAKTRAVSRPMRRKHARVVSPRNNEYFCHPLPGARFPPPPAPPGILIVRRAKIDRPAPNFRGRISGRPGSGPLSLSSSPTPPRIFPYRRYFILARSSSNFGNREFAERTHGVLLTFIKLPASFTDFHEFSSRLDSTFF